MDSLQSEPSKQLYDCAAGVKSTDDSMVIICESLKLVMFPYTGNVDATMSVGGRGAEELFRHKAGRMFKVLDATRLSQSMGVTEKEATRLVQMQRLANRHEHGTYTLDRWR